MTTTRWIEPIATVYPPDPPALTNHTHQPMLYGWYNLHYGAGFVRAVRPGRLYVRELGGDDATVYPPAAGDYGFLIKKNHHTHCWMRHELRDTPAYTNQSHEPMLYGWCGSHNDLSTYGAGVVRVVRVAHPGRLLVRELEGDALRAVLDELGFPELMPEDDTPHERIYMPGTGEVGWEYEAVRVGAVVEVRERGPGRSRWTVAQTLSTAEWSSWFDAEVEGRRTNPAMIARLAEHGLAGYDAASDA